MRPPKSIKFRQVLDEYTLALEWIENLGICIDGTRAVKYQAVIESFVEGFEAEEFADINARSREIFISLFEASDLSIAHKFLKGQRGEGLVTRLSEFVGGPDSYTDELGNNLNHSRNIGFELAFAARFASAGVDVGFDTTADVHLRTFGMDFFAQCKRPTNSRKIVRNLNRANTQLREDYVLGQLGSSYGVIGIDATRIINPEFEVLIAQDQIDLAKQMSEALGRFVDDNLRQSRFEPDQEVLGAIVRHTSLGLDHENESYTFSQRFACFPFHPLVSTEGEVFNRLNYVLGQQSPAS